MTDFTKEAFTVGKRINVLNRKGDIIDQAIIVEVVAKLRPPTYTQELRVKSIDLEPDSIFEVALVFDYKTSKEGWARIHSGYPTTKNRHWSPSGPIFFFELI
jgi:hypothetical protein